MKQQHTITWRGIALTITFTPDWLKVADHLEIETEGRVPLPVTETGYRSIFLHQGAVARHGGPVSYTIARLDEEARRLGWSGAQLSLF
jgi:hypothetical protein